MMQTDIKVEALRKMLDRGQPVTVLDVRPSSEWAEWAIPGSLNADVYDALRSGQPDVLAGVTLPGDRPVVTV